MADEERMKHLYCYICPKCGAKVEQYRELGQRNAPRPCGAKLDTEHAFCDGILVQDLQAKFSGSRNAEARDWVSIGAGVAVSQVARANREYADLGVTFDPKTGNARVPGNKRMEFLKRRGFVELSSAPRRRRRVTA